MSWIVFNHPADGDALVWEEVDFEAWGCVKLCDGIPPQVVVAGTKLALVEHCKPLCGESWPPSRHVVVPAERIRRKRGSAGSIQDRVQAGWFVWVDPPVLICWEEDGGALSGISPLLWYADRLTDCTVRFDFVGAWCRGAESELRERVGQI